MYIILMRHAIAVERKENVSDETRELTEKGRNKLLEVIYGIKKVLPNKIVLHSSPLTRAVQSAEIVANVFENVPIHLSEELGNGNHKEFFTKLSNEPIHFAIGHEPYLSEWLYEFTGVKQSFKKAAFALIEIKENNEIQFICYADAKDIAHLSEDKPWFDLFNQWLEVKELLDDEHISEITMHRYRILLRSFETLVYSIKNQDKITIPVELENLIIKLIDQTSQIRDLDVLLGELEKKQGIKQLVEPLKTSRQSMIDEWKVSRKELLNKQSFEIMLFGLITQYEQTKKKKTWIQTRFNHLTDLVREKVVGMDLNQDILIHDIRLLMKKIVYMSKHQAKYLSSNSEHIGNCAKEINSLTGAYLDYKKQSIFLDQLSVEYPELKNDIEVFKGLLDSRIPSSFTIHKMIYKFGKKIGVK